MATYDAADGSGIWAVDGGGSGMEVCLPCAPISQLLDKHTCTACSLSASCVSRSNFFAFSSDPTHTTSTLAAPRGAAVALVHTEKEPLYSTSLSLHHTGRSSSRGAR